MTSKKAATKRIRELEEELEGQRKKAKTTSAAVSEEFLCPISLELMCDPVRAEDGFDYERSEIERIIQHQGNDLKSPKTGEPMGPSLVPSYAVKGAIEKLVETGTISGELAEHYKQSKHVLETQQKAEDGDAKSMGLLADWYKDGRNGLPKNQELANEWRERADKAGEDEHITKLKEAAEGGDGDAAYDLGNAYENGLSGLEENQEKAYEWYQKSADTMNAAGIAMAAYFLINGGGGAEKNVTYGTCQMFFAAAAGSDLACRDVGIYHLYGLHGIPEDKTKALHFLKRATDGSSCSVLHMKRGTLEEAKEVIKQLEREKRLLSETDTSS